MIGPAERRLRKLFGVPDQCPVGHCDGWGVNSEGELCECSYTEINRLCPLNACDGGGVAWTEDGWGLCHCQTPEREGSKMSRNDEILAKLDHLVELIEQDNSVTKARAQMQRMIEEDRQLVELAADLRHSGAPRSAVTVSEVARIRRNANLANTAKFIQVSVLSPTRLFPRRWDTIDATLTRHLRIGDRVLFQPVGDSIPIHRSDGKVEGIVMEMGRGQLHYHGDWSFAKHISASQ